MLQMKHDDCLVTQWQQWYWKLHSQVYNRSVDLTTKPGPKQSNTLVFWKMYYL
uniref:Uncharacterized protein n=1 Tax=Kuenenia stuttgartiensis TaxID=174633 RepID=Q1Q1M3_KUEST|nr:unknown protein [Candidatus Kuenenia stuttgartiensis]